MSAGSGDHLFDHREMRRVWFVKARDHATDGTERTVGRDYEVRPPFARMGHPASISDRLERAHHRGADGDHALPSRPRRVHAIGRLPCHAKELFIGWLMVFEAGDARAESAEQFESRVKRVG